MKYIRIGPEEPQAFRPPTGMPTPDGTGYHIKEQLERRERELDAANRISQALFHHQNVEDMVEQALRTALDIVDAQAGAVLLADPDAQRLVFYHAIGDKAPAQGTGIPWAEGIAGIVFQSGRVFVAADVARDARHCAAIDEVTGFTTRDVIALPLKRWEGEAIGVLEVLNKRHGSLDDQDVAILSIIASFTALSIEQARLFEEAKIAEVTRRLGDVGHDIKNMLMPVINGACILRDELGEHFGKVAIQEDGNGQASARLGREVIDIIASNARRIQDRVREIADAVKGVTSPPQFTPCQVAKIVTMVTNTLRFLADERRVSLHIEGLEHLPVIQADEGRLFNAFYNLVNNAIPEVPPGGRVTVRGRFDAETHAVVISVADTGGGMPPRVRDSLFTARTISLKVGGTGLGTKIVKDVVDAHHGAISVESEEGAGATFHVQLPLDPRNVSRR